MKSLPCVLGALAVLVCSLSLRTAHAQTPADKDCPAPLPELTAEVMQNAQSNARERGMLWRLEKSGHVSYLYATVHVGRLDWLLPGPLVRDALRNSDALAVELDISDPSVGAAFMAALPPAAALPAGLQTRVQQAAQRECLDAKTLQALPPLLQASVLELTAARRDGFEAALAQELVLTGVARAGGIPVHSLETAARQAAALTIDKSSEGERLLKRTLDQLQAGTSRPVMRRMASAWERGDLVEFASLGTWCLCMETDGDRDLFKRLNDERNPALASRITALHDEGQRLFAAVGALHMTGPQALPTLLAAQGFAVERITFD